MIWSRPVSAGRPSASARSASQRAGQEPTTAPTAGSGATDSRPRASGRRSQAATISATVVSRPGRLTARSAPRAASRTSPSSASSAARPPTAARWPIRTIGVASSTGTTASRPASGSRNRPDANDEAAAFGRPGRMITVGRRAVRPSIAPRRVASLTSSSPIDLVTP